MKSYTELAVALYSSFKSVFCLDQKVTSPPKLPPDLERRIFEMCALECPEVCTVLVLVVSRVHMWIDPILISTVCLTQDLKSKQRDRLECFLAKLANGKPVEYYTQHIKNLAIFGGFFQNEEIDRILAICTGVENLVLCAPATGLNFFKNLHAGCNLCKLSIRLEKFFPPFGSMPDFYHPCFANLTHLHLWDEDWSTYAGWETLTNLTHLAFACSGPPKETLQFIQMLPTVQYVALGSYNSSERYKYTDATVNNMPHIRAAWGVWVVFLSRIPEGEGDFWDLVEQEVERRLEEGLGN
ncbi:hypothetical protein BYT27DRAFT_7220387 [Phlegmacium glaucopus]|nr:hypothetical protein BYT27DRAFT_7220387 [Phlegmacium glaucopus]